MNNDKKRTIKAIALSGSRLFLLVVLLVVVIVFVILPMTHAWFAENKKVNGNGIGVKLDAKPPAELACDATSGSNASKHFWEYLVAANGENRSVTTLHKGEYVSSTGIYSPKSGAAVQNPSIVLKSSSKNGEIQWWMGANSDFKDLEGSVGNLAPCAFGKVTFYVIVNKSVESALCTVSFTGYSKNPEGSQVVLDKNGVKTLVEPLGTESSEDIRLTNIINHHVLLFADYDEDTGYYSNWLSDGTFSVDLSQVDSGEAIEISLYWIWAGYYDQFFDTRTGNPSLDPGEEISPLCNPSGSDYANLLADIAENPTYYFTYEGSTPTDVDSCRNAYNVADSELGAVISHLQLSVDLK